MPQSYSISSPKHSEAADDTQPSTYVHTVSGSGRLLPSASYWNSIELDFNILPQSKHGYESIPSKFSKSYDFHLIITNKKHLSCCVYTTTCILLGIALLSLLLHFLPLHKHHHHPSSNNLTLAINQALVFFDAQKCNTQITMLKFFI